MKFWAPPFHVFNYKISMPTVLHEEDNLQRTLLRAQVIADEAMGWVVTNHAMLLQLDMLRDAIHRGYYTLDMFRYQSDNKDDAKNQTQPHQDLEVLPIVGPGKVGKSTLVAHVCKDERIQGHFSEVFFLHNHDFRDDELELVTFIEACAMKHQNLPSQSNTDRRVLFVVELAGNLNEDVWNMLYCAFKRSMTNSATLC